MTESGNGKGKLKQPEQVLVIDEDLKKALTQSDTISKQDDPTKFTLLENISDDSKSDWFTYYQNLDQVITTNDIETHARLLPLVFQAKTDKGQKRINAIAGLFMAHVKDNQRNMSALKRGQLLALVSAVRNDSISPQTDKEIKRLFGK